MFLNSRTRRICGRPVKGSMKTYRDHYFLKAKQENYPARSVYKLKELDARFRLFKPGMRVLMTTFGGGLTWGAGLLQF